MKVTIPRLELSMEDLHRIIERARPALSDKEQEQLQAAVDTLGYLTQLVEDKDTTIQRLRQILFGSKTETTEKVLQEIGKNHENSPKADPGSTAAETSAQTGRRDERPRRC